MSERALHIPPAILALPALSLLACAVLAEVLDLYRVNGQVFASDGHFATRLHSKPRTVRETIAELVTAGHLVREVNYAARHKRLLTPAPQWRNPPGLVADFATSSPEVVAESAGSSGEIRQDLWRNPPEVVADFANINTIVNTKEKEVVAQAANAVNTLSSSFSVEGNQKSKPTARSKKSAARADEIAALPLPHPGAEFADLWATFRTMPKQVKKPVSALHRLLATLGKYAESFACQMLDKAIQGAWSGVEFDGTAKAYTDWQAAQAEAARRQPVRTTPPPASGPLLNTDFLTQQQAREQQALADQNDEWHRTHNTDALFGYTRTAAEGLAQSRQGPDWERYQAEQAGQPPPDAASAA